MHGQRGKRGSEEKQVGVCKITFTPKEVPTNNSSSSTLEKFNYKLGLAYSSCSEAHNFVKLLLALEEPSPYGKRNDDLGGAPTLQY